MVFQFLGTSAGEQYPGIWCHCENCEKARKLGGRNIRQNTCAYIHPNMLIDFPPEIVTQTRKYNIDLSQIEHLLITHSHFDHFLPYLFRWRYCKDETKTSLKLMNLGPRFSKLKTLHIYGNREVCKLVNNELSEDIEKYALKLHVVEPFNEFKMENMQVIPVLANHSVTTGEKALNYIISDDKTTIFYGLDSGWFLPETYKIIQRYKYDAVIVEGTFGLASVNNQHFDFATVKKACDMFEKDGLLKEKGIFIVTHFCPHHSPLHNDIESYFAGENIIPAYDGMKINIGVN